MDGTLLIGTSGSTKCDWQLVKAHQPARKFSTRGINPFFHTEADIVATLQELPELPEIQQEAEAVFFYGPGCADKAFKMTVQRGISQVFPRQHLFVNHEIVAAALATYQGLAAFTCFLGTGANACFFDGDIVRQEVPPLDYVFGDAGSGAFFGKRLLKAWIYRQLPPDLSEAFDARYGISHSEILHKVYQEPYPNVYMASFMKFIQDHQKHPYIEALLEEGFENFIHTFVVPFAGHKELETHFVGSVAWFFQDTLRKVARKMGLKPGTFLKEPIDGLVSYHLKKNSATH
jgi:glucosamine kinase